MRTLLESGHQVRVLDDFSTGLPANLEGLSVDLRYGSITDSNAVNESSRGADSIVHLAARGSVARSIAEPEATHLVNATGTLNVLEAARAIGAHVIYSSSSSVYGSNTKLPKDETDWTQPISPYGASKISAESYTLAYQQVYSMSTLALRFFNVYGPFQRPDHDYAAVIPKFAWAALRGSQLQIHGDGEQTRDFTHVRTVISVLTQALEKRTAWNRPVNLALGERVTINDVAAKIGDMLGKKLDIVHTSARPGDVRNSQNSPNLLLSLFPEIPRISLDDGIESVISWLKDSDR